MPTTASSPITAASNTGYDPGTASAPTRIAAVVISGLAFLQNVRRGHYVLATDTIRPLRVAAAFAELAQAI